MLRLTAIGFMLGFAMVGLIYNDPDSAAQNRMASAAGFHDMNFPQLVSVKARTPVPFGRRLL